MRKHVVSEDVCAEDSPQPRFLYPLLLLPRPLLVLRNLRLGDHASRGDLVRRPRDLVDEVGANAPDGAGPVDARPATDAGIEDDGVEFGKRLVETAGEGAHGEQVREVDVLGEEGHLIFAWRGAGAEVVLQTAKGVGPLFGAPRCEDDC